MLTTEGHSPADYNIILMTEYKDLATLSFSALRRAVRSSTARTGYGIASLLRAIAESAAAIGRSRNR